MNKREKTLLIALGAIGLLFGGRVAVRMYRDSLAQGDQDIKKLESKLADIDIQKADAERARRDWLAFGAQTFSMDQNEASNRLRDELFALTRQIGLNKEQVNLGPARVLKNTGIRCLQVTVTAEGNMSSLAKFLFELYREPYMVRCTSLRLEQVAAKNMLGTLKMTAKLETLVLPSIKKADKIVPAKLDKDRKPVNRTLLETLAKYDVISSRKMWEKYVDPPPGKATNPMPAMNATSVSQNAELTWTAGANAENHKIFFGTTPPGEALSPQPATKLIRGGLAAQTTYYWRVDEIGPGGTTTGDVWSFRTGGTPPPIVAVPPKPVLPPPPQPPADQDLVLTRIISSPRSQQAVLEDASAAQAVTVSSPPPPTRNFRPPPPTGARSPATPAGMQPPPPRTPATPTTPAAPPTSPNAGGGQEKRVEVGEPMYGGKLVFVHPKGAVTERDGILSFHPIGLALKEARPLEEQPEVLNEFKKLQARAAGISERPG